jgi:uncharacterized protein YbcC (UPF0753/DUF2309 family)
MQETAINQQDKRELVESAILQIQKELSCCRLGQTDYSTLSFEQLLEKKQALTGKTAYLPESVFRKFYHEGRITDSDLNAALSHYFQPDELLDMGFGLEKNISKQDIYRTALINDFPAITISQLNWQIEKLNVFNAPQANTKSLYTPTQVRSLWQGILAKLSLQEEAASHPEALLDISLEQIEQWLVDVSPDKTIHEYMQQQASNELQSLLGSIGETISLSGFISALTGMDVFSATGLQLIRLCVAALDKGVAQWQFPKKDDAGFYKTWRSLVRFDANLFLHELPDWQKIMESLPDEPIDSIVWHLSGMNIPKQSWSGYLQCLAFELPGWFESVCNTTKLQENISAIQLQDLLAIRLTLDRLWLNQVCQDIWLLEANQSLLAGYFRKNLSEFMVRKHHYQGDLPEYLVQQVELLTNRAVSERQNRSDWQYLADLIWMWQFSQIKEHTVGNSGWRLFCLCQHLGITDSDLGLIGTDKLCSMLTQLDGFSEQQRNKIWLFAFEHHYGQAFFQAVTSNHRPLSNPVASVQIICSSDIHLESLRTNLEQLCPGLETLGVMEFPDFAGSRKNPDNESGLKRGNSLGKLIQKCSVLMHKGFRSNPLVAFPLILLQAPLALIALLFRFLLPVQQAKLSRWLSADNEGFASVDFTELTDSDIQGIASFFKTTGLISEFAPLIVLMGYGANNGFNAVACAGKNSGLPARWLALLLNRSDIRNALTLQGIHIPDDSWFLACQETVHARDTCWYNSEDLPLQHQLAFEKLKADVSHARQLSAVEFCRKMALSDDELKPDKALACIEEWQADFAQIRSSVSLAGHAAVIVGKRCLSQGRNFDNRVFLISYDPATDIDAKLLESLLEKYTAAAIGINLDYYFSTVSTSNSLGNSIVLQNITGFSGVMNGAGSDLATDLPEQLLEHHEAMRLRVLIQTKPELIDSILNRNRQLQLLLNGDWIHLSILDSDNATLYVFAPDTGFVSWQSETQATTTETGK